MQERSEKRKCCGEVDLSNLGTCRFCFILSVILNVICWSGYFLVSKYIPNYWLSLTILIFSCLFALLFLAHSIAFFVKK